MSAPGVRIEAVRAEVGAGMNVRRAVPTRHRRLVGPWCFLDHFGPADASAGAGMRVGPHPHCGLQTVTWLLQGELLHRDSLGSVQAIRPGQLNLMTAGRGISHSEESPSPRPPVLHGIQFWLALPEAARHGPPAFEHYPTLPQMQAGDAVATLLAGEYAGQRSPAKVHSPLVGLDIQFGAGGESVLSLRPEFEHGVVVTEGSAEVDGAPLAPGSLLYFAPGRRELRLRSEGRAGLALVGGEPFPEPVLMWWNFVARSKDELERACREWNAGQGPYGEVRGYDGARLSAPLPPWAASENGGTVNYP